MTSLGLTAVGGCGMGTKGIGWCFSLSSSFDFASGLIRIISKVSALARTLYSDRWLVWRNLQRRNLTLLLVRRVISILFPRPASFPLEADLMNSNREENCSFSRSLARIFVKPVQSPAVNRSYQVDEF